MAQRIARRVEGGEAEVAGGYESRTGKTDYT